MTVYQFPGDELLYTFDYRGYLPLSLRDYDMAMDAHARGCLSVVKVAK